MDSDCGEQCAVCGSVYQSEISFQTTSPALAARLARRGFRIQTLSTDESKDDAARLASITRTIEARAADSRMSDNELMLDAADSGALTIKASRSARGTLAFPMGVKIMAHAKFICDLHPVNSFRGYHSILGTTERYTESLRMSRNFTTYVGKLNNLDIFPYAVHYLFFQQSVWHAAIAFPSTVVVGAPVLPTSFLAVYAEICRHKRSCFCVNTWMCVPVQVS